MSQEIKTCNITINNEKYYDSNVSRAGQAMADVLSMGWNFIQFAWCGGCCCCLTLLFALIAATATAPNNIGLSILGLIILLCCCCSSYNYYKYYEAKTDLENISNSVKSTTDSRPCQDETTGQVYN